MYVYAQSELYREMDLSLMLRLDMMRIVRYTPGMHVLGFVPFNTWQPGGGVVRTSVRP